MRKFLYTLLLVPLISCTDWLSVESEKSVTFTNYFKNESQIETMFNAIMINFARDISRNEYRTPHDYAGMKVDAFTNEVRGYSELDPTTYLKDNNSSEWKSHYSTIDLANTIIDNRFRFENISPERADFWVAQCNFVKAMEYFYIAQKWGDAPIVPNSETIEAMAKQPAKAVLEEAARCAKEAIILPVYEKVNDSHGKPFNSKQVGNKGSVYTLLANIYAWLGGVYGDQQYWKLAEEYASEVIDGRAGVYGLESSPEDMINNCLGDKRNSVETIFSIEENKVDKNYWFSSSFKNRYAGQTMINFPYTTADTAEIYNDPDSHIFIERATVNNMYSIQDKRLNAYWYKINTLKHIQHDPETYNEIYAFSNYAFINKWRTARMSTNPEFISGLVIGMEGDVVVWRLADLILLRAECRVRQSKANAIDDLNRIRVRAGLDNYSGTTEPQSLRREIFEERTRELYGENCRYYDIVRNGYWATELSGKFKILTKNDINNGALYLPIGENAFYKNKLMKQNTYWLWQK